MFLKILIFLSITSTTKLYTLKNGLRVAFVEDKSAPVFFGFVQFDVGSANEAPGLTGTSHLLEHMLFKGTKKLGTCDYKAEEKLNNKLEALYEKLNTESDSTKRSILLDSIAKIKEELKKYVISEEIWKIYGAHGGSMMNAMTSSVNTSYFVLLPSNKKELWAKVESDRFKNLVLREFFSERDVVNEERRMGESNPYEKIWNSLISTAYIASPVRWPVIGWEDDIMNVMPKQVMWYYKTHYTPNKCVIVMIGDVDPEKDIKLIEKYFGDWEGKSQNIFRYTREPEQKETRRVHLKTRMLPTLVLGFKGPYYPDRDYYAMAILSFVLGESDNSILKKTLVDTKKATEVESFTMSWDGKAPALFGIYNFLKPGCNFDDIEKEIFNVLDSLKTTGLSEFELQKAKNNYKMNYLTRQRNFISRAYTVALGVRLFNDPEFYKKELEIIDSITNEDIKRVISKYLVKENLTVVTTGGLQ